MQPQGWRGHPRCALSPKADRPKADLGAPRVLFIVVAETVVTVTYKCFFPGTKKHIDTAENTAHKIIMMMMNEF